MAGDESAPIGVDQLTAALHKSFQPQGVRNFDVPQCSPCGHLNVGNISSQANLSQVTVSKYDAESFIPFDDELVPSVIGDTDNQYHGLSTTKMGLMCSKIEDSIGLIRSTLRIHNRLYPIPNPTNVEKTYMALCALAGVS